MADYGAAAAGIYDPQMQAEQGVATASHQNTLAGLKLEGDNIDPAYATVFKNLATARNNEAARTDFHSSQAAEGNNTITLGENEQRLQGEHYGDTIKDVSSEQANKHLGVNSRMSAENNSYSALSSALASKYAGLKSGYIQDQLKAEADRAFQEKMANQKAANDQAIAHTNASAYATPAKAEPNTNQRLSGYFAGYNPGKDKFFTEHSVIPQLMADTGMDHATAAKTVYDYRKQVFNE